MGGLSAVWTPLATAEPDGGVTHKQELRVEWREGSAPSGYTFTPLSTRYTRVHDVRGTHRVVGAHALPLLEHRAPSLEDFSAGAAWISGVAWTTRRHASMRMRRVLARACTTHACVRGEERPEDSPQRTLTHKKHSATALIVAGDVDVSQMAAKLAFCAALALPQESIVSW